MHGTDPQIRKPPMKQGLLGEEKDDGHPQRKSLNCSIRLFRELQQTSRKKH
jgi:hypothetical protein